MIKLLGVSIRKRWISVFAVVLTLTASLAAQTVAQNANQTTHRANRITQELATGGMATVKGSVHPLTKRATDLGAVYSQMPLNSLTLNIGLSAAQQKEMDALLEAQQDPKSPQYHQWLTQEEYGARFGLTDPDLNAVTGWLTSQGFTVERVSKSRNAIHFSGKTWQVESAFHTQLHRFQVEGKEHFANTTELRVPAAIGSVILNVRGLNSFRLKPRTQRRARPGYTVQFNPSDTENFLTPADWATIYGVNAIYSQNCGGTVCDGTGMHVGVVGQTYAPLSDINNFRRASGLTVSASNVAYVCIDPNDAHCTGSFAISTAGDLGEADLDIEWAGGIAKNATVDFVYAPYSDACSNAKCTSGVTDPITGYVYDVFDALQYAVEEYRVPATAKVLPVISMSYGDCEQSLAGDSGYVAWVSTIGQEANSQGQTIVVSSGDSGAFGCDYANYPAKLGVSVDVPADSPHYTAVGGTTLSGDSNNPSTYWNETPDLVNSALRYIPEAVWNETSSSAGLWASGGGVSLFYAQPSWQSGLITGQTTGRMVPDVAFAASANHDGYMICSQDDTTTKYGTDCANGFVSSQGYIDNVYGGTSAGAPSFAGMLTLLAQKWGTGLGNINPLLYNLASNPTAYATIFHDVTTGNSIVPCTVASSDPGCASGQFGWNATTGYDLATGLGSINGFQFFSALLIPATTTSLTVLPTSLTIGEMASFTASVTSTTAGNITGTMTFSVSSTVIGTAPVSGGTATLNNVLISAANGFSAGSDIIAAAYGGGADFSGSRGTAVLTIVGLPTTTTLTAPNSTTYGSWISLSASVASTSPGTPSGTVTFTMGSVVLGTAPVTGGTAVLNYVAVNSANGFSAGNDSIVASYSGDASFTASNGNASLTVAPVAVTVSPGLAPARPPSVIMGDTITLSAVLSPATSASFDFTGTITFKAGTVTLGTAQVSSSFPNLGGVLLSTANGFSIGANTITAIYSGDSNHLTGSGSTTLTVLNRTISGVTVSPASASIGGMVSLTVNVTSSAPGTVTGRVSFQANGPSLGSVDLSGGTATLNNVPVTVANGFYAGTTSVNAYYSGDSNYAASSGSTLFQVIGLPTTTTVTVTPSTTQLGGAVTLNATVSPSTVGGSVSLKICSMNYGYLSLSGGVATLSNVPAQSSIGCVVGQNTVTATYTGDAGNAPSSASTTFTVTAPPTYTINPSTSAVTIAAGSSGTVTLNLASTNYAGTVNMQVSSNSAAVGGNATPVTLVAGGNGSSTVTITTTANASNHAPAVPWKSGGAVVFCAVLLGAPFTRRRKHVAAVLLMALAVSMVGFLVACGGGGGGSSAPPQPRIYTITVTPAGTGVVTNSAAVVISVTVP